MSLRSEESRDNIDFKKVDGDSLEQQKGSDKAQDVSETMPSSSSLEVNYDSKSVISDLSSISSLEGPIEDTNARRNSSRYRIKGRPNIEPSLLNNFLDFLSMCFWKCSPGCQQLPKKQC